MSKINIMALPDMIMKKPKKNTW